MKKEVSILRQAQLKMLDILIEVDRVCKKNNIRYWLDGGTLIGAVRHGGFIPWDDDIDICMMPEDYKKFLETAPKELDIKNYFLHHKGTDPNMTLNSSKIRDRNFLFVEKTETNFEKYHQGIFIDIFPMVYLKNINKFSKRFFKIINKIKDLNPYAGNSKKQKLILRYLGFIWLGKKLVKYFFSDKETQIIGYRNLYGNIFKRDCIFPLSEINFEGYNFSCPNNYSSYLTELYGDYMQLPKEEERVWHAKEIKLNKKCEFEIKLEKIGRDLYESLKEIS